MNRLISIFTILINSIIAFAQVDNIPMSVGIGGGIDIISNRDISASPLDYSGFGLPIGMNGFKLSHKWINHFEIQLTLPILTNNYQLKSKAKTSLTTWAKVNFKYQLLKQIGRNPNNYVGGQIKTDLFYREYDFLDGFGWEFQNSLNISYARKLNLSDKSFILPQISLPLLGYINRKSSLTFDEEFLEDFNQGGAARLLKYGDWRFQFDKWLSIELDLLYYLKLSERLSSQGKIGLSYYSVRFPEKVKNINLPIRCYINYQL